MANYENDYEMEFHRRITAFLNENDLRSNYGVIINANLSEFTTDPNFKNRKADFIIMKGRYPFMIIELKGPRIEFSSTGEYLQNVSYELELIGADYFIITNLEKIIVVDSLQKKTSRPQDFNGIYTYFKKDLSQEEILDFRGKIVNLIRRIIKDFQRPVQHQSHTNLTPESLLLKENFFDNIDYNSEGRFFHFHTNPQLGLNDFENQFFQTLLEPVTEQAVCRYTTFDSIYQMIKHKSYRMSSDIAMNDRGEIDYVDKYIGLFYKPLQSLSLSEMHRMNKSYISSCTTFDKKDDLTMYRLYAEDSKGVCLCFNVTNGVQSKYMLVKKISYAKRQGVHPELDLIRSIINNINTVYQVRFRFLFLDTWKHFFKTHDYEIEKEVRVLYLDNSAYPPSDKGWVITDPDKILSKYAIFHLNDPNFPLSLDKIILGPNCPESQLNKRQFEVFLDEQNISTVKVENSKIESYRKT